MQLLRTCRNDPKSNGPPPHVYKHVLHLLGVCWRMKDWITNISEAVGKHCFKATAVSILPYDTLSVVREPGCGFGVSKTHQSTPHLVICWIGPKGPRNQPASDRAKWPVNVNLPWREHHCLAASAIPMLSQWSRWLVSLSQKWLKVLSNLLYFLKISWAMWSVHLEMCQAYQKYYCWAAC